MTFEGGKPSDPRSDDELTCVYCYIILLYGQVGLVQQRGHCSVTDVIKLGPNDTSLTPCSLLRHLSSLHMSQYQWYYLHTKYNFTYKWKKKSLINASYKILSYSGNDGFILGRLDGNLTILNKITIQQRNQRNNQLFSLY